MSEKLCVDCKHHMKVDGTHVCHAPGVMKLNLVDGSKKLPHHEARSCEFQRVLGGPAFANCGAYGDLFEPKETA